MRWGVYIGRFQPFHNGHLHVVRTALEQCDRLLVIVGSDGVSDYRNPWRSHERREMVLASLADISRIRVPFIKDYARDGHWRRRVHLLVSVHAGPPHLRSTTLFGCDRGNESYLQWFPEWQFVNVPQVDPECSGTAVRAALARGDMETVRRMVPPSVFEMLERGR